MFDQPARSTPSRLILQGLLLLGITACLLIFVVPLAMRSITLADEGYLLLQALDLANGKVLYRDMDAFVTPGVWFLLAGVFKFAGPSVWVSRVPIIIAWLALMVPYSFLFFPVVEAAILASGVFYILMALVVDILYAYVDPRIRL